MTRYLYRVVDRWGRDLHANPWTGEVTTYKRRCDVALVLPSAGTWRERQPFRILRVPVTAWEEVK